MNLKCGKKKNAIIIIIGIVTVAICITAAVLVSRAKKKAAAAQFVPETETYSEESEETLIEEETGDSIRNSSDCKTRRHNSSGRASRSGDTEKTDAAETEHNAHKAFKRAVYRPEKKISHRL